MSKTTALESARAWLASQRTHMISDLIELANQNSYSENRIGLDQVAQWLADWCEIPNANLKWCPLPARHIIGENGDEQAVESGVALQWNARPNCARRVLLGIHYDTVYPPEHQPDRCIPLTEEQLRGPGVADAKGGIIVVRYALQAIERFGLMLDMGWTLLLTPDEEIGSPASSLLWTQLATTHEFGLLFEPALASGALVAERKGSGSFSIVVRGRSAHAGRDFSFGRNALALASHIATRLDALNGRRSNTTVNIGQIAGGGPVNVVPDLSILRFNVRVPDSASQDWFQSEMSDILSESGTKEGFLVKVYGGFHAPPKSLDHAQRELMNAIEESALSATGAHIHWQASGGVSDGNRLSAAGLPNIDTMGPIGDKIHSSEEWVDLSSLVTRSQWIVELLAGYDSGRFPSFSRNSSQVDEG